MRSSTHHTFPSFPQSSSQFFLVRGYSGENWKTVSGMSSRKGSVSTARLSRRGVIEGRIVNGIYNKNPATTEFQQLRSARCGETRKQTALSAPYTHPRTVPRRYGPVRPLLGWFSYIYIRMREETLSKQLLSLRKKTSWSWERMCYEFHRVMGAEGPSHTTLFRYASGRVKRPHVLVEQYVRKAIHKVTAELSQK